MAHRRSEQCRRNERRLANTGLGPVGALIGHLHGGMSRKDLEEIGESDAAMIVVGGATVDRAVEE